MATPQEMVTMLCHPFCRQYTREWCPQIILDMNLYTVMYVEADRDRIRAQSFSLGPGVSEESAGGSLQIVHLLSKVTGLPRRMKPTRKVPVREGSPQPLGSQRASRSRALILPGERARAQGRSSVLASLVPRAAVAIPTGRTQAEGCAAAWGSVTQTLSKPTRSRNATQSWKSGGAAFWPTQLWMCLSPADFP